MKQGATMPGGEFILGGRKGKPRRIMRTVRAFIVFMLLIVSLLPAEVLGDDAKGRNDSWTFGVAPYLWLPGVNGTLKYSVAFRSLSGLEVNVAPGDYLQNLAAALFLSGEARKGEWGIFTDFLYLHFSNEKSEVRAVDFAGSGRLPINANFNTGTKSTLQGLAWSLLGTYRLVDGSTITLDGMGGFRYFGLKASTDWQLAATVKGPGPGETLARAGSASGREDILDAVVGIKGRVTLGSSHWFVPYYFDVGTGTSIITWQGLLGIGYSWGGVDGTLAYRHLSYSQGGDKLAQDLSFSGPGLGVIFRF
jgi:hypothetical protein